ncbi:MAG: hypothetical protein LBI42_12145 [Chitinispirillales bacterium]|jgi:hypothetical protein|nr:hypothetical protein [Chitinispirillales bacterium]
MKSKVNAFIVIYTLELENLKVHLREKVAQYIEDHDKGSITNYVFRENRALLENEINGLDIFINGVHKLDTSKFDDLGALRDVLNSINEKLCAEEGIARTTATLAKRKADRIVSYFMESERADEEYFSSIGHRRE